MVRDCLSDRVKHLFFLFLVVVVVVVGHVLCCCTYNAGGVLIVDGYFFFHAGLFCVFIVNPKEWEIPNDELIRELEIGSGAYGTVFVGSWRKGLKVFEVCKLS